MNETFSVRDGAPADASILAKLLLEAGEGLYEFIFSDLEPGKTARDVIAALIEANSSPLGYENFRVALRYNEDAECDVVVGMAHTFAAERLPEMIPDRVPADRTAHIGTLLRHIVDDDAMMLNAIAVKPSQRGMGVGVRLIAETVGMATAARRKRLIARTWDNNERAMRLYGNFGFKRLDSVELPAHNRLSARRSVFLSRDI